MDTERRAPLRERAHDPALTALLIVQSFILLVAAPVATTGHWSGKVVIELAVFAVAAVVFVISHGLVPTAIAVLAIACGVAGVTMQLWALSNVSLLLGTIGSFGAQLLVIYLLGHAVLAPGEITGIVLLVPSHCTLAWEWRSRGRTAWLASWPLAA